MEEISDNINLFEFLTGKLNGHECVVLSYYDFEEFLYLENNEALSKEDCKAISDAVYECGFGLEPDIRYQNLKVKGIDPVVIFNASVIPEKLSPEYKYALMLVKLAALAAAYDGFVDENERKELYRFVKHCMNLAEYEVERLCACAERLLVQQLDIKELHNKLVDLNEHRRNEIVELLKLMIVADGYIDKREVSLLRKIYELFELDTRRTKRDIQKFAKNKHIVINKEMVDVDASEKAILDISFDDTESVLDDILTDFGF